MSDELMCTNPYGSNSGPCDGPAAFVAVLYSPRTGGDLDRSGVRCRGHADYEVTWRRAAQMLALARVEPATAAELAPAGG